MTVELASVLRHDAAAMLERRMLSAAPEVTMLEDHDLR